MIAAAIDWTAASTVLSGFAIFFVVALIPGAIWFHRKVIRPLSFVLGLKAEESPTGQAIPPIPTQISELREIASAVQTKQVENARQIGLLTAEMHPNGGHSMRDVVDRNERNTAELSVKVVDLQGILTNHLADEKGERDKTAALALKTAAELATLQVKTAADLAALTSKTAAELAKDTSAS